VRVRQLVPKKETSTGGKDPKRSPANGPQRQPRTKLDVTAAAAGGRGGRGAQGTGESHRTE